MKNPEEIIREGILPRGTKEEWHSSLEEKVLVGSVKTESDYETYRKNGVYQMPVTQLKPGWQEAKYIALYAPKNGMVKKAEFNTSPKSNIFKCNKTMNMYISN